jgi:hypothetical protein
MACRLARRLADARKIGYRAADTSEAWDGRSRVVVDNEGVCLI